MALALIAFFAALGQVNARPRASVFSVTQSDWDAFNASVSGRLHDGVPMLASCYAVYNGESQEPDPRECDILQENRGNHLFVSDQFGGYQQSNWAGCQETGENCAMSFTQPDFTTPATRPCLQGSVPRKYVDARSVEDVQKTLLFAEEKNLRLVVKNTGHDYLGRSSAPDSFALWTHHIQPAIELTEGFIPDECSEPVGDVITFGAGQQFSGVYEFANAHGYRVVGGTSPSVGIAGGWTAGGGHSMLSNELGLGVDNVQQIKAVLPNGTYITANRCQNQDLFFALRGGGGGTFGVVIEMSFLVHPKKPMQFARLSIAGLDEQIISDFFSIVIANADKWASEGWGGYILPAPVGGVSTLSLGTTLLDLSEAQASMQPLIELANRPANPGTLGNATVITADYYNILQAIIAREEELILPSSAWAFSSRLVTRESFVGEENQQQLSSGLHGILTTAQGQNVPASSALLMYAVAPSLYSRTMPETDLPGGPGAASITPAWRNGLWHVIFTRQFDGSTTDPSTVQEIWQTTHDIMNPLRDLTPGGGAYQNEADPFEPDPVNSFWGQENYARLLQIKWDIDPTNLLTVHNGVGWDETDERYSCYPDIKVCLLFLEFNGGRASHQ
ncbi:uncharacterized protein BJX67DRAFT_376809 [Aspergillus lucknowensis]|uniref:FAD-binding PCMH-type domain-containing protein n=1 Tax=Aspergillus lucknowensis TaxID=176173 RepID=A0ABR4M5U9_9EURO